MSKVYPLGTEYTPACVLPMVGLICAKVVEFAFAVIVPTFEVLPLAGAVIDNPFTLINEFVVGTGVVPFRIMDSVIGFQSESRPFIKIVPPVSAVTAVVTIESVVAVVGCCQTTGSPSQSVLKLVVTLSLKAKILTGLASTGLFLHTQDFQSKANK